MLFNSARLNFRYCLGVLLVVSLVLVGDLARAQSSNASLFGPEFGGGVGTLLPNQIDGVTEILPAWGLKYSHPFSFFNLEGGVRNSHAKGVDWSVLSLDLRFDMNTVEGFTNIFYMGYDVNRIKPTTRGDHYIAGGVHFGTGLMMHVASNFWLRTDLSLAVKPGTSLFLGLGFVIRTNAGG